MVGRNSGHFSCFEKQVWIPSTMDYDQGDSCNSQVPYFHRKSLFGGFISNVIELLVHQYHHSVIRVMYSITCMPFLFKETRWLTFNSCFRKRKKTRCPTAVCMPGQFLLPGFQNHWSKTNMSCLPEFCFQLQPGGSGPLIRLPWNACCHVCY